MSTAVLMWNPAISSYTMNDYLDGMVHFGQYGLNWSVWEYEKVQKYDRFVMVRVGEGKTGIVQIQIRSAKGQEVHPGSYEYH